MADGGRYPLGPDGLQESSGPHEAPVRADAPARGILRAVLLAMLAWVGLAVIAIALWSATS